MLSISECKNRAKEQLGGGIFKENWMLALLVCVIQGAVFTVTGTIGVVFLVIGPLAVGLTAAFVAVVKRGEKMDIGTMFKDGFGGGMFGRNFLLGLLREVFVILWSLLFFIPGIIMTYAYGMADYIAVLHPEYGWRQCLKESKRLMKGHKWKLFVLDLSFIGWYIVGMICLGVGTLWVVPYHKATQVNFFDGIVEADVKSIPEAVAGSTPEAGI